MQEDNDSKLERPTKRRRQFPDDFKQDAVNLVVRENYTFRAAAKAMGVGEQSLRQWYAKLAPKPAACGPDATLDQLRAENERLRGQLRRAEMEREILKKATAYFANESQ
jgi:transposase